MTSFKTFLPSAFLLLFAAAAATADESKQYNNLLTPILQSGETIIGQPIAYPSGTPKVTAATIVLPPGKETGWHTHAVPIFAYILDGEISVDYGDKGIKVYKAGDRLLDAMNWPHNGVNRGRAPLRILVVYIGADGKPNATSAPAPAPKPQ